MIIRDTLRYMLGQSKGSPEHRNPFIVPSIWRTDMKKKIKKKIPNSHASQPVMGCSAQTTNMDEFLLYSLSYFPSSLCEPPARLRNRDAVNHIRIFLGTAEAKGEIKRGGSKGRERGNGI